MSEKPRYATVTVGQIMNATDQRDRFLALTPAHLRSMALHTISEVLGEDGLRTRFALEIPEFPQADRARLQRALDLATDIHRYPNSGRHGGRAGAVANLRSPPLPGGNHELL